MFQSKQKKKKQPRAAVPVGRKPTKCHVVHSIDYELLARFRYQLRKFLSFSEAAASKAGLTPQQHQALLVIKGFSNSGPLSVGDMAQFLLVRHHTAVELVDRIAKLGLLRRIVDNNDSRRIFLKLTRKGEQKLRTLSKIHFEELQAGSAALTKILRSFRRSQAR
jgi:DNA-binding MarR family transcriptional regulator